MTASVAPRVRRLQEVLVDPQETCALLRLGLDRLPLQGFPHLWGLVAALAGYDGAAELVVLLDILLDGLRADQATPG